MKVRNLRKCRQPNAKPNSTVEKRLISSESFLPYYNNGAYSTRAYTPFNILSHLMSIRHSWYAITITLLVLEGLFWHIVDIMIEWLASQRYRDCSFICFSFYTIPNMYCSWGSSGWRPGMNSRSKARRRTASIWRKTQTLLCDQTFDWRSQWRRERVPGNVCMNCKYRFRVSVLWYLINQIKRWSFIKLYFVDKLWYLQE